MSNYNNYRGGGRRGGGGAGGYRQAPYNTDRRNEGRPYLPHPPHKMSIKDELLTLADAETFVTFTDIARVAGMIASEWWDTKDTILQGFEYGITENPHKLPYYAAVLLLLSRDQYQLRARPTYGIQGDEGTGRLHEQILSHLGQALEGWMKGNEWIKIRLTLSFFGQLAPCGLVTPESLTRTLRSLITVVEQADPVATVVDDRVERVIRCFTETLLRAGPVFGMANEGILSELIQSIDLFNNIRNTGKEDVRNPKLLKSVISGPRAFIDDEQTGSSVIDNIDLCILVLQSLQARGFTSPNFLPTPWTQFPRELELNRESPLVAWEIPGLDWELTKAVEGKWDGEGACGGIGLYDFQGKISGLTDANVPKPDGPEGWCMRSLLVDIIYLYEINRTECMRILMAIGDFTLPDHTFGPQTSETGDALPPKWSLPSSIINTTLSIMLTLPISPHKTLYYATLVRELCVKDPNKMAPPVGMAVKRLFPVLDEFVDVEVVRRFAEWFAIHLSNFAFHWMWKEWATEEVVSDLPETHPKRAFIARIIDLEVRLSYHDRILSTLPDSLASDPQFIGPTAPDPDFRYTESHEDHDSANELLTALRSKISAQDALLRIQAMAGLMAPSDPIPAQYRDLAVQVILQLGTRSFSHFLNATERYLPVLKALGTTAADRSDILVSAMQYWKYNSQQRLILLDKYLMYGVVEAEDVVRLVFGYLSIPDQESERPEKYATVWTTGEAWDVLKMVVDKMEGRVVRLGRRVAEVEKEEEEIKQRRKELSPGGREEAAVDGMDIDEPVSGVSPAHQSTLNALSSSLTERSTILRLLTTLFILSLSPRSFAPSSPEQVESPSRLDALVAVRDGRDVEADYAWEVRARLGWFVEFCRTYAKQLRPLSPLLAPLFVNLPTRETLAILKAEEGEDEDAYEREKEGGWVVRGVWGAVVGV